MNQPTNPENADSGTTRENASNNAYLCSENAYHRTIAFLESRQVGDEYWCPKNIAEYLSKTGNTTAESTIRGVLKQLRSEGKVFCLEKGKFHLYAAARRFANDFNYMFKNYGVRNPLKERYEIHGLTLKLTAQSMGMTDFKNALPLGGLGWDDVLGKVQVGWEDGCGVTTVQLYREVLLVQVRCSDCPFDFDRLVAWLAQLDGFLLAKGWCRVQGNFGCWSVVQYGLNRDFLRLDVDKPPVAVSLQGFRLWFARVYDKTLADGSDVRRFEVHNNEAQSMDVFLSAASGSMAYVQVMNLVQGTAHMMDNAVSRIGDIERAMSRMARNLESLERSVERKASKNE